MVQDYRAESYQKRAEAQKEDEDSTIKKGSVSIDPRDVVKSDITGRVAVRGGARVQFTPYDLKTSPLSSDTTEATQPVNPEIKSMFTGEAGKVDVPISPSLAQKLSQQSLRDDEYAYYSVSAEKKNVVVQDQSFDVEVNREVEEKKRKKESFKKKATEIYESTPLYPAVEGIKYAFSKPDGSVDEYGRDVNQVGKEGFANLLTIGGLGITAEPTIIRPRNVDVKSRVAVVQEVGDKSSLSKASISSDVDVERGIFGRKKSYTVTGTAVESGRTTELVGRASGEPIIETKGLTKLKITDSKGRIVSSFESESVGGEVGGLGQRRVVGVVSRGGRQRGVVDVREVFVGETTDKGIYGGLVSKKGTGLYVGEKVFESEVKVPGTVKVSAYDPVLGLDVADRSVGDVVNYPGGIKSTIGANVVESTGRVSTVKGFNVLSAGQSQIPSSAKFTEASVRFRLSQEKPMSGDVVSVVPGSVSGAAREQISVNDFSQGTLGIFKQDKTISRAVEVSLSKTRPSASVISGGLISDRSGGVVESSAVTYPKASSYNLETEYYPSVSLNLSSNGRSRIVGDVSNIQSGSIIPGFRQSSISRSESGSRIVQVNLPASGIISRSMTEFKPAQASRSATEFKPSLVQQQISSRSFAGLGVGVNLGITQTPGINIPPFFFRKKSPDNSFSVDVRRFGKFETIGAGLSKAKAISVGRLRVENTAAATFRVKSGGQIIKVNPIRGYYSKEGLMIESPSRRIKSYGELSEITYKGVQASRRRGLF